MKVVVTDCDFSDLTTERRILGPDIEVVAAPLPSADQLAEIATDADGLLVQYMNIDDDLLARLPNLRAIVRYGIGLDNIDVAAADRRGIRVRNVPDYCIEEVAEHALASILQVSRRLVSFSEAAASGWNPTGVPIPKRLRDQVVGIVGMGRIGQRLATLAASLGSTVICHDPYAGHLPRWGPSLPLEEVATRADHLSLHLPLNEETSRIVGSDILERLGPEGHLVNTSRGGLVDEEALLKALDTGALGWASLDVLQTEPPTGTSAQVVNHPRVLVTPHVAYLSKASLEALPRRAAETMVRLLKDG